MFCVFYPIKAVSYLLCIETANPRFVHRQQALADYYCSTLSEEFKSNGRKIQAVSRNSGISERYSVINDFAPDSTTYSVFPQAGSANALPNLNTRMEVFKKEALTLSLEAVCKIGGFEGIKNKLTHIITVTCTGLFAPGLDIELVTALGLKRTIHRSSINFMGCNAAVLACRQAHQICTGDKNAVVLIVCTELCTLHFQNDYSDDYILSNTLFGDGSAAAIVSGKKTVPDKKYRPVKITSFHSLIVDEGMKDMAWQISEKGFIMNLSSYVSGLLNNRMQELLASQGIRSQDIHHWAIHPGGKKILDEFCSTLTITKEQLKYSYNILRDFGNMSSATILFVLKELMQSQDIKANEKIYAAAFGPGLTIESAILQHV
jgi:alpha-pyrone synthase